MKHEIKISEADIYKFVFSPESLDQEKKDYLENNQERFKELIEYCRFINEDSFSEATEKVVQKVMHNIAADNLIELFPSFLPSERNDPRLKLAAKSSKLEKKNYSYSFTDSSSDHVVKIINTDSQTLLYFFSSDSIKKVKVSLFPSGTKYIVDDTSKPTEILDEPIIEKISIERM